LKRYLLIDDQRSPEQAGIPNGSPADPVYVRITRNFDDGMEALKQQDQWDCLYLDHDLGCFQPDGKELTGYTVLCRIEESVADPTKNSILPGNIVLVTSNGAVRMMMQRVVDRLYGRGRE
jgi:hypothetical protein